MTEGKRDARRVIEDLELEKHLAQAGALASRVAQDVVIAASGFADQHRATAHEWIGRAESEVNRVTGGKGADLVGRVRSGLDAGVDLVADQRPGADPRSGTEGGPQAGPPSSGA